MKVILITGTTSGFGKLIAEGLIICQMASASTYIRKHYPFCV